MKNKSYYQVYCAADDSLRVLKNVRDNLKRAGATKAAQAVSRALKSVEGARRHADLKAFVGKPI